MANQFLTPEEAAKGLLNAIEQAANGMTPEQQRGFWYDVQSAFGCFPVDEPERERYINGI